MSIQGNKIRVGLYFIGDGLDPAFISQKLGLSPSRSQYKGEKKTTSTNREYVTKTGMWELIADSDTPILSDHINQLLSDLGDPHIPLHNIVNVQEAYLDVFIVALADKDGGGICEFNLSKENLAELKCIGLPVHFTIAVVNE